MIYKDCWRLFSRKTVQRGVMAGSILRLTVGQDLPSATMQQWNDRKLDLFATVEHYLPEFVHAVKKTAKGDVIVMTQAAFAAGLDHDEYILFGMAMKYAGEHGAIIHVIPHEE